MTKETQPNLILAYYISYIEIGPHASIMLSARNKDSEKIQINYEVGLIRPTKSIGLFTSVPGEAFEEHNASKTLYSNKYAQHRTYEITQSEYIAVFAKINADRRQNLIKVPIGNKSPQETRVVGGPRYHVLSQNCKNYALSFIRKLDPEAVKVLENKLIQKPGSCDAFLTEIKKENLSCPMKEERVSEIITHIENLKEVLMKTHLDKNDLIRYFHSLYQHANKIGINYEFSNVWETFKDKLTSVTFSEDDQSAINEKTDEIQKKITELIKLANNHELKYYWNKPPVVSRRLKLSCDEHEKKLLSVKEKFRLAIASLDEIILRINKNIFFSEYLVYKRDLKGLRQILRSAKADIGKQEQSFNESDSSNLDVYVKQMNTTIKDLETKIAAYKPICGPAWRIIQFIKKILNSFNKEDNWKLYDSQSFIKDELLALKEHNNVFDNRNNLSFLVSKK